MTATAAERNAELPAEARVSVDVQVACDPAGVPDTADIEDWVHLAVANSGRAPRVATEVAVRVVDVDESRGLNETYRRQARPTNVLSFPAAQVDGLPDGQRRPLGDVVVCAPVVTAEALAEEKPAAHHWGHLLVHGTLHLLGYDHEAEQQAAEMQRLEARILALRGVPDPYASV